MILLQLIVYIAVVLYSWGRIRQRFISLGNGITFSDRIASLVIAMSVTACSIIPVMLSMLILTDWYRSGWIFIRDNLGIFFLIMAADFLYILFICYANFLLDKHKNTFALFLVFLPFLLIPVLPFLIIFSFITLIVLMLPVFFYKNV